jgi:hypothetical protein
LAEKTAFLIDGGFAKKKLQNVNRRFPTVTDIVSLVNTTLAKPELASATLLRAYFYDAPPFEGTAVNPINGATLNFSGTIQARQNQALLQCWSCSQILPFVAVSSHFPDGNLERPL